MTAIVIGSGQITDYEYIKSYLNERIATDNEKAYMICCDGGATHAKAMGFTPDIIVGDLDSIDKSALNFFSTKGIAFEKYSAEKDYSDLEIGVNKAIALGAEKIIFLGATGDRLDHTLTNLGLLYRCLENNIDGWIVDDNSRITLIDSDISISGRKGETLSLLPFTKEVTGICAHGLYYPLNDESLSWGTSRGVSNIFSEETAEISLKSGVLAVVLLNKADPKEQI